ncbi:hypothetical protein THRCLA_10742, partial [Thraustotheca clavata]
IHPSLLSVNLSNNEIGESGGILLGETLAASTCTIRHFCIDIIVLIDLDLSWNQICLEGAIRIGRSLQSNTSIQHINLSMNRFGDRGGHALATALLNNKTLRTLDLSRNNLTGCAAVTLSYAIQHNSTLSRLALLNNDLGGTGTKALLHAVARGISCDIAISFRDSDVSCHYEVWLDLFYQEGDLEAFDPMCPSTKSPYILDLKNSPYHYVIACELVAAAAQSRCELYDIWAVERKHDSKNEIRTELDFHAGKASLVEKASGRLFELKKGDTLYIAARFVPLTVCPSSDVTTIGLLNVINVIKSRISTREMCAMLEIATFDLFLNLDQVKLFVEHLRSALDVVDIIARTLHAIVDSENTLGFILDNLSFSDMNRLLSTHGFLVLQFNPKNPTGRYSLDLTCRIHRKIAIWFAMINRFEATNSMRLCPKQRGNTSQQGNFSNFRNGKFNGHALEITEAFYDHLPIKGTLEFDYVSTTRPEDSPDNTVASVQESDVNAMLQRIEAELWSDYVPQHRRLDMKRQVVLLQHALCDFYVTTEHVRMIMQYFPKNLDGLRLKVVLAAHRYIVDMENFEVVYEKLLAIDRK